MVHTRLKRHAIMCIQKSPLGFPTASKGHRLNIHPPYGSTRADPTFVDTTTDWTTVRFRHIQKVRITRVDPPGSELQSEYTILPLPETLQGNDPISKSPPDRYSNSTMSQPDGNTGDKYA